MEPTPDVADDAGEAVWGDPIADVAVEVGEVCVGVDCGVGAVVPLGLVSERVGADVDCGVDCEVADVCVVGVGLADVGPCGVVGAGVGFGAAVELGAAVGAVGVGEVGW